MYGVNANEKIGMAILWLFAATFAVFGLFAFVMAWRVLTSHSRQSLYWVPLIVGTVFSVVGFGLMYLAVTGKKRFANQQWLQSEHPTEPWMWRDDWAGGRANSATRRSMIGAWVFAILWNLASFPYAWLASPTAFQRSGAGALIVLIFPVIGMFLLLRAIRATIAFLEFGTTYFTMETLPGVIGGYLKGTIQARLPHSPRHGIHLRISCVCRERTGAGRSQSATEQILWCDEADLTPGQFYPGPMGTSIPVAFRIPGNVHPTETVSPSMEFVWLLEAMADVPGVDYHDVFEVPVFRTAATPSEADSETSTADTLSTPVTAATRPDHPAVLVRDIPEGTEFNFPPARNRSLAFSTSLFTVLLLGFVYLLLRIQAPVIFPIVFGLFCVPFVYFAAQHCLATSRVVIGDKLTLQAGMLGGGGIRQIALGEIATIGDKIQSQTLYGTTTPYYDIVLQLRNGGFLTVAKMLRSKCEAEWVVSEMRRLVAQKVTLPIVNVTP